MSERLGILIAIVSSLGGTAAAINRYMVGNADPLTLAILRWGIGFLVVLPMALMLRVRWPMGVANTMTVNPIAAALLADQLVGERITLNLVLGLVAVFAGIWIATTQPAKAPAA